MDENLNDDDEDGYITPEDAVKLVRDDTIATFASGEVEASVWRRISGYMFHNTSQLKNLRLYQLPWRST